MSDAGWRRWQEDLAAKQRAFESRWGVILGKKVYVSVLHHPRPLTGRLEWINPDRNKLNAPPRFRLKGIEFGHADIESVVQLDDSAPHED